MTTPSEIPAAAREWIIEQDWRGYDQAAHEIWRRLYARQNALLPGRACAPFLRGLEALGLEAVRIPDFADLNHRLMDLTGWRILPVPGLVPDEVFFELLAARCFPAARFIRDAATMDYLSEPDVFHDVFGHAPMLADSVFADYMQAYGRGGLRASGLHHLTHLARLYWRTVEFGLLDTPEGLRIYGAGIVSSRRETIYALEDPTPGRIEFDLIRVMRTEYRIDDLQETYFVISSFQALLDATLQDFAPIYASLKDLSNLPAGARPPGDRPWRRKALSQ